MQQKQRWPG